jgi:hypothetical protein
VEYARRCEVFDGIEAASELLVVAEIAIPLGPVLVVTVGDGMNRRDPIVRAPDQTIVPSLGIEAEGTVLVMQRVVIASRQKRSDGQPRVIARRKEAPRQRDERRSALDDDRVLDGRAVGT